MPDIKERPILFSGAMVRAILDGHKTQTRRVIKPQPNEKDVWHGAIFDGEIDIDKTPCMESRLSPYGVPGSKLWVREAFRILPNYGVSGNPSENIQYKADGIEIIASDPWKWKPSIHMPRSACRILLEITKVRVERLQNISRDDAKAEGVPEYLHQFLPGPHPERDLDEWRDRSTIENFSALWDSINAKRDFGWDANPWVFVIEFRRVDHD